MANTRISQVSFARGELAPALYSRTDIEQYSIGLKTLKNGFIHQEGCVSNRSGLEFVGKAKISSKKTRLIPFTFNSEQTYILEFGHHYIRFIQDGGYITYPDTYNYTYEGSFVEHTWLDMETSEISYSYTLSNGDNIYVNGRMSVSSVGEICYTNSALTDVYTNGITGARGVITSININASGAGSRTGTISIDSEQLGPIGDIVEIESPYGEDDLQYIKYAQSADVLTLTHPDYPPKELARYGHADWRLTNIIFEPCISAPTGLTVAWTGSTSTNTRDYSYLVTAVDADTLEESERSTVVTATGHREAYWTTSEYFTLSWTAVANACEYNIYRNVNGIYGYVGTAEGTSFVDDNIEPDLTETAPMQRNPFENNNYPSCSCYYQQRKIYANTTNNPQGIFASQTAASDNFNSSRPLVASDAVDIVLADREVNEIRHLIPFKDLIALTSNSEYKINGSDGIFQATPAPVALVQSCYGSSHVQPVVSGSMVLFVQSGGNVLRDLGYDYLSDSYDGDELSILASHLFEGKEIVYMSYAKEPYRLVYVVLNDGSLAVLTYNKKQKLCGWSRYETQGKFESVAVVREGQEDIAYFVVNRTINNETVRCIERTTTRIVNNAKTGFFVDCGLKAHFDNPVTSLSGLDHLAGADVIVLADGGVVNNLTVSSLGTLTLPAAASDIIVGLPYEFEFETLGVESNNTHGLKKQINTVSVKVLKSREDFDVIGNLGSTYTMSRSAESISNSGYLFNGAKDMMVMNTPVDMATIHIKQTKPLPLTIAAVSAIVNIADIEDRS